MIALHLWHALRLAAAIHQAHPEIEPARVLSAATAITREHGAWDPLLVAAIGHHESRFVVGAMNPVTGTCGPMQVAAPRAVCRAIARGDERLGYRIGVRKLDDARRYCLRRSTGLLTQRALTLCTLAGFASGPAGVRGRWYRMPRAILRDRAVLRRAYGPRPGAAVERGVAS